MTRKCSAYHSQSCPRLSSSSRILATAMVKMTTQSVSQMVAWLLSTHSASRWSQSLRSRGVPMQLRPAGRPPANDSSDSLSPPLVLAHCGDGSNNGARASPSSRPPSAGRIAARAGPLPLGPFEAPFRNNAGVLLLGVSSTRTLGRLRDVDRAPKPSPLSLARCGALRGNDGQDQTVISAGSGDLGRRTRQAQGVTAPAATSTQ
mmetsp:Transcript_15327/g.39474  ORF Transcript_15327/g.39474 Transcript_15327/m.39474 type:complete len:204 (+) Transcript_15327:178-789(+)